MTRTLAYSLSQLVKQNGGEFKLWSLYDTADDLVPKYVSAQNFKGFGNRRLSFLQNCIRHVFYPDVVIISHINLALFGLIIKIINPKCKIWLIAHGIEVWRPLSTIKRAFIHRCDKVLCVSGFTRQEVINRHNINPQVCVVLNNAIDPFIKLPSKFEKPDMLLKKYGLTEKTPIIFTLTRLASTEQYKGHEQVIKILNRLKPKFPGIKYILAGQSDPNEAVRIKQLISAHGDEADIILTGFIKEEELADYFLMADLFVLPSKKEGFGIVFIEALACGLPVICGNEDGSLDAIRNGELGKAITVNDLDELEAAISAGLNNIPDAGKRSILQKKCLHYFNEQEYRENLKQLLAG